MPRRIIEAPEVTNPDETTFAPVTHQGGDGRVSLGPATTTRAGLMSAEDKQFLDGVPQAIANATEGVNAGEFSEEAAQNLNEVILKTTGTLVVSPNLFNINDSRNETDVRLISDGSGDMQAVEGWLVSHPIELTTATEYFITFAGNNNFAFFDAEGNAVSGGTRVASAGGSVYTKPADAVTLRFSINASASTVDPEQCYVIEGNQPAEFFPPYGGLFDLSRLKNLDQEALAENAVTPRKTSFLEVGKNKYSFTDSLSGFFMNASGVLTEGGFHVSDFIPVQPGQVFVANRSLRFRTAFNSSKTPIPNAGSNSSFAAGTPWTIPEGVAFVRLTVTNSNASVLQFEEGSEITEFEPFRYEFTPDIYFEPGTTSAVRPSVYGIERLRESQARLRSLDMGVTGLDARLNVSLIGDSWTHSAGRYASKLARALWRRYDDSEANGPTGLGWIGFHGAGAGVFPHGSVYWNNYMTGGGVWTSASATGIGPDISHEISSDPGAHLQPAVDWNYDAGFVYSLIAQGGAGVVRYRWTDASDWVTLDLSALPVGIQVIDLPNPPASGSGRWRIEVVSGTCALAGVYQRHPSAEGVVVNKLGATGTRLQQWVGVDAATWQTGFAALDSHLTIILHGTNDQMTRSKVDFKADLITMIDRVRTARPASDVLLVTPCENQRTNNALPMSAYAEAMYEVAHDDRDVAYIDLQPFFGQNPQDYAPGSFRPWFTDDIHPNNTLGGMAVTNAILKTISA